MALLVALFICAIVLTSAALGAWVRQRLPAHHMNEGSRDIVKVNIGLIATISALVLGLLVASAKSSFDTKAEELTHSAARTILLDRNLREYGGPAMAIHDDLKQIVIQRVAGDMSTGYYSDANAGDDAINATSARIEHLQHTIRMLDPATPAQRMLQARALDLATDLAQTRWLLLEQRDSSIPLPFLVVLVAWLAIFFGCMGLYAPRNATVYIVIGACALSVSSAIFLILELDQPFSGLLRISDAPFANVIRQISQ